MPSFRRGLPEQRAWRQPLPLIDGHLSPPLSGCSDATALKLRTQALNLVDQVEHHGMALQIGLEIQLQARMRRTRASSSPPKRHAGWPSDGTRHVPFHRSRAAAPAPTSGTSRPAPLQGCRARAGEVCGRSASRRARSSRLCRRAWVRDRGAECASHGATRRASRPYAFGARARAPTAYGANKGL